jgi:hypothetical protein
MAREIATVKMAVPYPAWLALSRLKAEMSLERGRQVTFGEVLEEAAAALRASRQLLADAKEQG